MKTGKGTLRFGKIDLIVEYEYTTGYYPATLESPEEPEEFYITNIYIGEVDITELLSDNIIEQIEILYLELNN